jgi:DNA invertase Pin-like site-specific DNA recombinase
MTFASMSRMAMVPLITLRAISLSLICVASATAAGGAGDVLLVTKLDRLARSTRDLLNTLAAIGDRGAGFRSLSDPWPDTTTFGRKLKLTKHQQQEALARREAGEALAEIGRSYNVSRSTIGWAKGGLPDVAFMP